MIIEMLTQEFEHECKITRRLLDRLPEDKFGWKPHEKSMSLARLSCHLTELAGWVGPSLDQDELSFDPATFKPWLAATRQEVLDVFDKNVAASLEVLKRQTDAVLGQGWTLKMVDKVMLQMPKGAVMRGFVLSHMIHHRGQLSVYLRLLNVPVPSIYGPSADEPAF